MIRSIYRSVSGDIRQNLNEAQFREVLQDKQGALWVDIVHVEGKNEHFGVMLREVFGFHPLAVDDALHESHIPRIDDWQHYLYIVLQAMDLEVNRTLDHQELDVFLGPNYIVTIHTEPIRPLDRLWDQLGRGLERRLAEGPDHLLYALADAVVADYMPVVDGLDEEIDELENEIFDKPRRSTVGRIFRLRRTLLQLRRMLGALREVMNKLARDEYGVIDAKDRIYFRDVYDHLVRLYDIADGLRDMVVGALDSYVSVTSNRLNEIMRTLTVVSILCLPLTFITGFFGMNFFADAFNIDNPTSPYLLFVICLLSLALIPPLMLWYIRRRGWLRPAIKEKQQLGQPEDEDEDDEEQHER
jgi:magnesium transporter